MIVFAFLKASEYGQAGLAVLVAVIGYILHRKSNHIEVKVDGQMTLLAMRVAQLEAKLTDHGLAIPPAATPAEQLAVATVAADIGKINGPTEPPAPPAQD